MTTQRLALVSLLALCTGCTAEGGSKAAPAVTDETTSRGIAEAADPTDAKADDAGFYAVQTKSLAGEAADLAAYRGKVTLVVNVASRCGYTPQYGGLQKLHEEMKGEDFAILAFPSNDFGKQEPGTPEEIQAFCSDNYGVTFDMFEKVQTKGAEQSPVYASLEKMTGEVPGWNFCKYVIARDGSTAKFFGSSTTPDSKELRDAIRAELDKSE